MVNEIKRKNPVFPKVDLAISATECPFSLTLAKRVVMSCTAPIRILPNTAHSHTGMNPKIIATVGPMIGPPPAMLAKWCPKSTIGFVGT